MTAPVRQLLKRDTFGAVSRVDEADRPRRVERDSTTASAWIRWLARRLASREARALEALEGIDGVPRLLSFDGARLERSWLDGEPMHRRPPASADYFREALRLLRRLHARGVVHNDLAKEPNWLVTPDDRPALVDFQLATRPRLRGKLFRALAYDDLRHLLKHKRSYFPDRLSARQRRILATRSWPSALWAATVKPPYRFVTRRILGWADREGAGDRYAA